MLLIKLFENCIHNFHFVPIWFWFDKQQLLSKLKRQKIRKIFPNEIELGIPVDRSVGGYIFHFEGNTFQFDGIVRFKNLWIRAITQHAQCSAVGMGKSKSFPYSFFSVLKFISMQGKRRGQRAQVNIHCVTENVGVQFDNQLKMNTEYHQHFPIFFIFSFLRLGFYRQPSSTLLTE